MKEVSLSASVLRRVGRQQRLEWRDSRPDTELDERGGTGTAVRRGASSSGRADNALSPDRTGRRRRVIHVAEAFGGGVAGAILDYVRAAPEVAHDLVYAPRADAPITAAALSGFREVHMMPTGHVQRIRQLREIATGANDLVIHAHSSYAGAYVRLAAKAGPRVRIVYTPHCYAFERMDFSALMRSGYKALEAVLALNTTVFAGCSEREVELSTWPLSKAVRVCVPNIAPIPDEVLDPEQFADKRVLTLAGAGRVSAQKDPSFFVEAVRAVREAGATVRAVWIGGGSDEDEAELRREGVRVTGWLDRQAAIAEMASADAYLHTGRWEGFPVAVLEASALGVPVVVRDIPAFASVDLPYKIADPVSVVPILSAFERGIARFEAATRARAAVGGDRARLQREGLLEAWGVTV